MTGLQKQFGPFSSDSRTKVSSNTTNRPVAGSDDAFVYTPNISVGKKGSATFNNDFVTNTTYVDPGAFDLVGQLITAQSGLTSGALDFAAQAQADNAKLAETKVTDGANLNQKTTLVALAVLGALAFLFMLLRARH